MKVLSEAVVLNNEQWGTSEYYLLRLRVPEIASQVKPGQFVHLQIPNRPDLSLRRPFSIYQANTNELTILYKIVGTGTTSLTTVTPNSRVSVIGPLGNGFPEIAASMNPILVAGGYGSAALYLLAKRSPIPGTIFIGGRTKIDILGAQEFAALNWKVVITTEDGSLGTKGLVTEPFDAWLDCLDVTTPPPNGGPPLLGKEGSLRENTTTQSTGKEGSLGTTNSRQPEIFACGPNPMLKEIGKRAIAKGYNAWLSVDRPMGCGIGVCLACAQKIRTPGGTEEYQRVCTEGPVFECRQIVWDQL